MGGRRGFVPLHAALALTLCLARYAALFLALAALRALCLACQVRRPLLGPCSPEGSLPGKIRRPLGPPGSQADRPVPLDRPLPLDQGNSPLLGPPGSQNRPVPLGRPVPLDQGNSPRLGSATVCSSAGKDRHPPKVPASLPVNAYILSTLEPTPAAVPWYKSKPLG